MDDVIGLSPKLLACSVGAYPVAGTLHLRDLVGKLYLYGSFQKQYKVPSSVTNSATDKGGNQEMREVLTLV